MKRIQVLIAMSMNGRDMVVARFYIASQIVPTEASLLDPPDESNSPGFYYFCVWQFMQFFCLILSSFLSISIPSSLRDAMPLLRKRRMIMKKIKLHELPYTKMKVYST